MGTVRCQRPDINHTSLKQNDMDVFFTQASAHGRHEAHWPRKTGGMKQEGSDSNGVLDTLLHCTFVMGKEKIRVGKTYRRPQQRFQKMHPGHS